MALPTFHCLECDQDFKPPHWECAPGQKHTVTSKRYYMDDAPTVPEWRDNRPYVNKGASQTLVLNIPPEATVRNGEEYMRVPGGTVLFIRGMFETSDPEQQFHLDRKPGLVSKERWTEVYLNDDEKLQIEKMAIAADRQRIENERNDLLAQVKAMKAGTPAEAPKRRGRPPKILAENPA